MNAQTQRMYDFIVAYKRANDGNSPTTQEMMAACGYLTTSVVRYQLNKLQAEGLILLEPGRHCFIRVVGGEWNLQEAHDTERTGDIQPAPPVGAVEEE